MATIQASIMSPGAVYPAQVAERIVAQLTADDPELVYTVEYNPSNKFYARVKASELTGEEVGYF